MASWLLAYAWEFPGLHPYWWLAPTYNQVVAGFRLMVALASSAGVVRGRPTTSPFPVLSLVSGSRIEFRSWEREQNLMGTSVAGGVIDEAGLLTPEAQAAISSRRSETLGPLRYIGNPGIVAGPFRRLCGLGIEASVPGSPMSKVYSFHRWTWQDKYNALLDENPAKAADYVTFIEQERASLPDFEFRRLYDAEWTEDEAAVFRGVASVVSDNGLSAPDSDQFCLGVDVAQVSDYLCAVSIGAKGRRLELRSRMRGVPYPAAAVELASLQRSMGNAPIVLEINGPGVALAQEFDRLCVQYIPFTTTSQSKQELVMTLAADVQEKRVTIADHAPMPEEFERFRYERTPSGTYRYSAPSGEHDDTVMAACLARWGLGHAVVDPTGYGWQ